MSRRSYLLTFLLIFILALPGLACSIGGSKVPAPSPVSELKTVYVSPSSGRGDFEVSVNYFWSLADQDYTITCSYAISGNYPMPVTVPITHKDSESKFTINVTTPGNYSLNCDDSLNNAASTQFTVTDEPEATGEGTKPVEFTKARITFDGNQIQFDTPPLGGGGAAWLQGWCFPPDDFANNGKSYFTVAEDGTLDGKCSVDAGKEHILGEISGLYSGGVVSFHLVSSHTAYDDDANNWKKALDLTGDAPVIGGVATGNSHFIITCDALGWWSCGNDLQNLRVTGTVPFTITFLP